MFAPLYVRVDILITRGKHLHDRIISQKKRGGHNTSLTPPLFIEVPVLVPSQKVSGHVHMLWLSILPLFL